MVAGKVTTVESGRREAVPVRWEDSAG